MSKLGACVDGTLTWIGNNKLTTVLILVSFSLMVSTWTLAAINSNMKHDIADLEAKLDACKNPPTEPPVTSAPTAAPTEPPTNPPTEPPTEPPTAAPTAPPTNAPEVPEDAKARLRRFA